MDLGLIVLTFHEYLEEELSGLKAKDPSKVAFTVIHFTIVLTSIDSLEFIKSYYDL
jgi:hypothetical protein